MSAAAGTAPWDSSMYMTTVFTAFAAASGLLGLAMPHLVHRLGFRMMLLYLACAAFCAVLNLLRRAR